MPGKKIYFASDFHLGARYIENPIEYERRIVRWLDSIKQDAGTLYLLGDILDYWYEYRYVVPKGFTRFFGKLAELSDNGIDIHWFIGNHDIWIFDYLPHELGITIHDGNRGKTFLPLAWRQCRKKTHDISLPQKNISKPLLPISLCGHTPPVDRCFCIAMVGP